MHSSFGPWAEVFEGYFRVRKEHRNEKKAWIVRIVIEKMTFTAICESGIA